MTGMTDEEIEAAVAHDMKIMEEQWREMGYPRDDEEEPVGLKLLNARLESIESRFEARIQSQRADLMRWMMILFGAMTLLAALIGKL